MASSLHPNPAFGAELESELAMLPTSMEGLSAIELGCGTGYGSAWMARRGTRVTGVDLSSEQLATARRLAAEHGADVRFVEGNAEALPFDDAGFEFALSEYGAAIWCDPARWIVEAHRVLRPGGRLVFLGTHPLAMVCTPPSGEAADDRLQRSWFDLGLMDWRHVDEDPGGMEFALTPSAWMRLFREVGFEVEDYLELQAPEGARDAFGVTGAWARRFPAEQVWKLRRW